MGGFYAAPPIACAIDDGKRVMEGQRCRRQPSRARAIPDLAGRTVFVSGGGSGIGAAFVAQFAAQGCRVAFVDIADAPSRGAGRASSARAACAICRCDVRDIAALQAAIADARPALGPIRVLVNNAARDDRHAFEDVTPEYWDENLAVNLRHHFFAAQAVAPAMAAAGGGSIINLGSVSWMRGRPGARRRTRRRRRRSTGLTRALARELGAHNIRVNSIVPGRGRDRAPARALGCRRETSSAARPAVPQVPRCRWTTSRAPRCSSPPTKRARSPARSSIVDAGLAQTPRARL